MPLRQRTAGPEFDQLLDEEGPQELPRLPGLVDLSSLGPWASSSGSGANHLSYMVKTPYLYL